MSTPRDKKGRGLLEQIARRAMKERDFLTSFSHAAVDEVEKTRETDVEDESQGKDLRDLQWASIDNDDSLDLDQLTTAVPQRNGGARVLVAVADVDALVRKDSAVDKHARHNTTSIYTAGGTFPMLPERLSTDLTSLNYLKDRAAIVVDMIISDDGEVKSSHIYRGIVMNKAKLAYNRVAEWLEGKAASPGQEGEVEPSLAENLRIQDSVAQKLRARRQERGALELQNLEARPVFAGEDIQDLRLEQRNRARDIIEDFMIAANDEIARFLRRKRIPSLRRVVRTPKRWGRIIEIAAQYKFELPAEPDSKALASFLVERKAADPLRFPDLSLIIIKLLGSGEYVVELPDEEALGHFGLAVKDYTHSTAPNRRFPDLISQRILKALLEGSKMPYAQGELEELARHCTEKEDDANKVERLVAKSAAAMLLSSRVGDQFDAICTGAADKGTWVRVFRPPVEGRLLRGYQGVDVGNRLKVKLIRTDVENGYIDFEKVV